MSACGFIGLGAMGSRIAAQLIASDNGLRHAKDRPCPLHNEADQGDDRPVISGLATMSESAIETGPGVG